MAGDFFRLRLLCAFLLSWLETSASLLIAASAQQNERHIHTTPQQTHRANMGKGGSGTVVYIKSEAQFNDIVAKGGAVSLWNDRKPTARPPPPRSLSHASPPCRLGRSGPARRLRSPARHRQQPGTVAGPPPPPRFSSLRRLHTLRPRSRADQLAASRRSFGHPPSNHLPAPCFLTAPSSLLLLFSPSHVAIRRNLPAAVFVNRLSLTSLRPGAALASASRPSSRS